MDNLLAAGRCSSTEFHANGAIRIIGPAMSTGQAAGLAAALLYSVSCKKDNPTEKEKEEEKKEVTRIAVESIRLDKEAISLEIDEEVSCTVTATAEGGSKSAVCVVKVKAKPKESLLEGRFSVSQEKKVQL